MCLYLWMTTDTTDVKNYERKKKKKRAQGSPFCSNASTTTGFLLLALIEITYRDRVTLHDNFSALHAHTHANTHQDIVIIVIIVIIHLESKTRNT